jgi:dolichyl-phosphate beta-glucosyltransferase
LGELIEQTVKKADISVVIPCYNESKRIENCIIELTKFFFSNKDKFEYELIFVNDGSKDDTYHKIKFLSQSYNNIKVFTYNLNAGKGYAVRRGIKEAKYNNILILDSDLSIKPDALLRVAYMHNLYSDRAFMVQGKRRFIVKQSIIRQITGNMFKWFVKALFQMPFSDSQSPFKVLHNVKKHNLQILISDLKEDGFAYDVELLYACWKNRIMVHEIIVDFYDDRDSKVTIKKAMKMFLELLRIRFS